MLVELEAHLPKRPVVEDSDLPDFFLPSYIVNKLNSVLNKEHIQVDSYTSNALTNPKRSSIEKNYAVFPNQYFVYVCKVKDFAEKIYEYFKIFDNLKNKEYEENGELVKYNMYGSRDYLYNLFKSKPDLNEIFTNDEEVELFSKFMDKDNNEFRLKGKNLVNERGEPRGAEDCFSSVLLTQLNVPNVSSSIIGTIAYLLCENKSVYEELTQFCKNFYAQADIADIIKYHYDITLPKSFILLAGLSGTGKTRFVRQQAEKTGRLDETYCLTSVRPDWHEPSDLLGYISRLDGRPQFIVTDVLYFIVQAWREILSAGVRLEKTVNGRFVVSGEKAHLEQVRPYWLCLDEMNLAPVEQYFADYLSTLETREWAWSGESFSYSSDPLLKSATMAQLGEDSTLREDLGLQSVNYDMAWEMFHQHGIGIPFNLIVAGTVNMDETTHGFSRKVIDRALSFDFGAFFPNDFDDFFVPTVSNKVLSYPLQSQAGQLDLKSTHDSDGQKSIAFLEAINKVLKGTPFELAYRALNELLLAVTCAQPQDDKSLIAVWDDYIMCKVLPRIEGDNDKLTTAGGDAILIKLNVVLQDQLAPIFDESHNDVMQRPDLYRERIITDSNSEKTINIPCRSIRKLEWMQQRLVSATFTSFWP
ncbi:hypothetical protein QQF40_06230 [Cobetia sp. LC6]|uniref:McrB family protein n=1 Tax=Cobetia sp. LC6 TaxID=3050947 RepID=UPI002556B6E3|nr:hypothetical protein [Cobetia sp. LC6]MDL2190986.1 hypothetical protein [Cobetia sp. LC6]